MKHVEKCRHWDWKTGFPVQVEVQKKSLFLLIQLHVCRAVVTEHAHRPIPTYLIRSQICIRHNKKCSLEESKKLPPECGLDLRGYDQFLYYFCTFLRNRPPSWRISKRMKKWIKNNQISCSGLIAIIMHNRIPMPGGVVTLSKHTSKNLSITISIQRQTGNPFVSLF